MKKITLLLLVVLMVVAAFYILQIVYKTDVKAIEKEEYGEKIGNVNISVSCNEAATQHFKRGLALMHHMTYEGARAEFVTAIEEDPNCSMGYWGQAMTYIHPLWSDQPSNEDFGKAQALLSKAKAVGQKTPKENAYINAVEAYFDEERGDDEKANLYAFKKGWEKAHLQFPEDPEAASFYALAILSTVDPSDKTYAKQIRAAQIVEDVLADEPNHPGAHHYIIHAYDYPELSQKALPVARSYGELAPEIPHALHMPSHIFTRLGYWDESIQMNQRAADAALRHPVDGAISLHYLHALDYLVYAYLQQGNDEKAEEILSIMNDLEGPFQIHLASSYPFSAIPARLALERQQWTDAADLKPRIPDNYPWEKFPSSEAITYFSIALGAARSGDTAEANRALEKLASLRDQAGKTSPYWEKQIETQRLTALAWLKYEEGKQKEALDIMKQAAKMEASSEKHPISPGEVLPSGELLAEMLLDLGLYQEALEEYEASLKRSPNRFNSLYGAGLAASLAGKKEKATEYYNRLIEVSVSDTNREEVKKAKNFLNR